MSSTATFSSLSIKYVYISGNLSNICILISTDGYASMMYSMWCHYSPATGYIHVRGRSDDNMGDRNNVSSMGGYRSSVRGESLHVRERIRMLMPVDLRL
jgi:hypothetical protein